MHLSILIVLLSLVAIAAFPVHRELSGLETDRPDLQSNQAVEKSERSKDANPAYKSHVESATLYTNPHMQGHPMVEEMRRKLHAESERLRTRLRQELLELQDRLSLNPAQPSAALASLRQRLAPMALQVQSQLNSNTHDLCGQLSLYLQGLETAEVQSKAGPALYREAVQWISQTLDHSGTTMTQIVGDFQNKVSRAVKEARENNSETAWPSQEGTSQLGQEVTSQLGQEVTSQLGQEVRLLTREALSSVGALKAELLTLMVSTQPFRAEVASCMERFCQDAALQNQVFQARVERLVLGLGEKQEAPEEPVKQASPSSPPQEARKDGALQEDFSARLSALIQDILHTVQ